MGLIDKIRREDKAPHDGPENGEQPVREERRPLTEQERERLIEESRSNLPELDRQVEENVDRLRDLSKS
jgi:hypothetical protein